MTNKKFLAAVLVVLLGAVAVVAVWYMYRYDAGVLALTFETTPLMESPLSGANYSWEAKAYTVRNFGNAPFDGQGYVHRERVTSENRFRNTEYHNLNVSLQLRFQVTNQTGYLLCNHTVEFTDGCDRQVTFEFKQESAQSRNTLQIRIMLDLNARYNYGSAGGELRQLTLQKEWTHTIQIQATEPPTGTTF
jgi:hypothetical protein